MELEPIGKYKVLGKIGQGSMGVVYKALDPVLNRFVAIKTISAKLAVDSEARKRFLREAQSAARLNHPNIVTVYDFGEEHSRIYMAMELLEGKELKQIIGAASLTELSDKLKIMSQICDGLAFAHEKDVIHRDLKPANIHILPSGDVKIMDFGLARFGTSELTATGTTLGTPNYMSPEQVRGHKADARSDIFSLGAVFYELLTQHKAFDAESLHSVLFQVAESDPLPVRHWTPDTPEILVRLLERALAKDPALRFRHAGEMREALRIADKVIAGELDEEEGLSALEPVEADETIVDPSLGTLVNAPAMARPGEAAPPDRSGRGPASLRPRTLGGARSVRTVARPPGRPGPRSQRPIPAPPARSPLPVYLLGGALILLLGAGLLFQWTRSQAPLATPTPAPEISKQKEQVDALTEALVTSQLELAQESLKDKNFEGAVARAEGALKFDPQNLEAKKIVDRAQTTLKELDGAAAEARTAFQAGDTDKASQALSKVLAINPNHPVAAEMAARLNRYFKVQAEDARKSMSESRTAADRARAGGQPAFAEGVAAVREGEKLLAKGEFAVATRKYLDARDAFERAGHAAVIARNVPPPPPPPPAHAGTPPQTVPTTLVASVPTLPPATLAGPGAGAHPPVPSSQPAPPPEEPAIRRVLDDFERAVTAKDVTLLKAVKPNLSPEDEKRFREIFKLIKSYQVSVTIAGIQIDGAQAKVRLARRDTIDGKAVNSQPTFVLIKGPGGWTIRDFAQ
ncbi:MAG TPA: protein kinase [Vicinamibacteria bacterium]|nr:protein kinase [Vicinamibacteria bacterium]